MKNKAREVKLDALFQSDHFFSSFLSFFEKIPCASYFIYNLTHHKILHTSASLSTLTGYTRQYFSEDSSGVVLAHIHPDDKPEVLQVYKLQLEDFGKDEVNGSPEVFKYSFRFMLEHGYYGYFEVYTSMLHPDEQMPALMIGMVKDVTEVHRKTDYLLTHLSAYVEHRDMDKIKEGLDKLSALGEEQQLKEINEEIQKYKWLKVKLGQLSERELQVLKLIAGGFSSKELAEQLSISSHTATSHRKNLMQKFNVKNTAELIKEASKVFSFN